MLALFANPESIALILVRMMALVMTAPLLGHRVVPVRFRVLLGILLTVVAIPIVPTPESPGADRPDWLSAAVSEMTIGLSLGLGVMLVFSAARMVGGMISQLAAIPTTGQATEGSDTPLSHWFGLLSLAAFALLNGPELMVAAVLDTFAFLPLGCSLQSLDVIALVGELLRQSFLFALRGVAPAMVAMLASTLTIGLISRTMPQFNLLELGLNANLITMLLAVSLTLGGCVWLFANDFTGLLDSILDGLRNARDFSSTPVAR